ncbi:MAG: DUF885 family protein [Actinomycetota bacterium]
MAVLEQPADRVSAAIWNLHPQWAVALGKHEYDGQVPDLTGAAVEAGLDRLGRLRDQVAGLTGLTPEQEVDREVLLGVVDRERFEGEVARRWQRDPAWYLEALGIAVYLERDYAPAGLRLERAAAVLGEAGGLLAAARANLDEVIPRAWAERAVAEAREAARDLATVAESPASAAAPEEAAWLGEAAQSASGELEAYAAWIEAERLSVGADDFALGREGLEEWLRASESLARSADDLAAGGVARLVEDQEALVADAAALAPGLPLGEACARAAAGHPEADPAAALAHSLEEARRFEAEHDLVSPSGHARIEAARSVGRIGGEGGRLQAPGPYDDPATKAVLYPAPAADGAPGRAVLDELAVTAAYPGSLLAALQAARAPGEVRRRFPSRGLVEGWSLYAGDLMAEAGFKDEAPAWRLLWRRRVVVADCRLVLVPRLHAGDLSLEEAVEAFVGEAHLGAAEAWAEALDCAADPGGAAGALGRVEILEWRRRWREAGGAGAPLRDFHDALLAPGALPLGLLDRVLLP